MIIDHKLISDIQKVIKLFDKLLHKKTTINVYEFDHKELILGNILIPLYGTYKNATVLVDNHNYHENYQYNIKLFYKICDKNEIKIKKNYLFFHNNIEIHFHVTNDRYMYYIMGNFFIPFIEELQRKETFS